MRQTFISSLTLFGIYYFLVNVHSSGGEKILFFFIGGSYSHKSSAWPWAIALADGGHEVTFLSSHDKTPSNQPNIVDLSSKTLHRLMSQSYDVDRFLERERGEEQTILYTYNKVSVEICETTLLKSKDDEVLQNVIHNATFDLIIINMIFGECGFIFAHHYNAKVIAFDPSVHLSWFYDVYGYLPDTSWIPDIIMKYENSPFSFLDRMKNTFWPLYWFSDRYIRIYPELERIMKEAFNVSEVPHFQDLEKNTSLVFINTHPAIDFALSLPPFVVLIGGMNTYLPEKAIPEKYQNFMDGASSDVVLISFGSTVNLDQVSPYYSNIFFQVVQNHKNVRFLMKWNGPVPHEYENLDNLMTSDWLPQRELLRHSKVRAFITHGGLNSIQEATFYGVPLIALPLFSDQDYNSYRIEAQEVGFKLEIRELSFERVDAALTKILRDDKYKKNMKIKSKIFKDRPQSPLQTVMYWTEFVLRHDDVSALKPMNSHLTWYQRRLLDVYLAYLLIILLLLVSLGFIVFIILKTICLRKRPVTNKKKLS